MYRGSPLPMKSDPKAVEKAKEEARKRENSNAERIATLALGKDATKPVAAATVKPVVVEEPKPDTGVDEAFEDAEKDEEEDEDDGE